MPEKDLNKIIAKNITNQLELQNKNQMDLADYMGVTQTTVSNWCRGEKMPRMKKIDMICNFFNINRTDLMNEKKESSTKSTGVKIPVLGYVRAGIPIDAVEEILDYEEISKDMASTGDFFALRIKGNSMQPRIWEDDIVIVKQQNDVDNGDIAIVLVNGDDATCKKIKKRDDGIMLIPNNSEYEPMFFTNQQVQDLPVTIIGRVVELRGKF